MIDPKFINTRRIIEESEKAASDIWNSIVVNNGLSWAKLIADHMFAVFQQDGRQRKNEITFKQWSIEEAERQGVKMKTIQRRYYLGWYPDLKVRRLNRRVSFVQQETKRR